MLSSNLILNSNMTPKMHFFICSTPDPYPSPINPVGVSVIIVKISTTTLLLYSLHRLNIYTEKIQLPSPHERYQPKFFWVMSIYPQLKIRTNPD